MRSRRTLTALGAAVALAAGAVATATLPAVAAATGCSVTYTVQSQWSGGFTANIGITNLGTTVPNWALAFDFPSSSQQVVQGWSASWQQSGARVTVDSASWNGSLGTGASTSI